MEEKITTMQKKKAQPTYKELGAIVNKKIDTQIQVEEEKLGGEGVHPHLWRTDLGSPPKINILNMPLLFNFDEVTFW